MGNLLLNTYIATAFSFSVGLAGICTPTMCKAHRHAKHANNRKVWEHALRKFWKITLPESESEGIVINLSPFDIPVNTGTQKCIICMPIHAAVVVLQKLYIKIAMLLPLIAVNAIINVSIISWFNLGWEHSRYVHIHVNFVNL